jgi:hypothetical protein
LADNAVMNVTVTGYNYGIQSTSGSNSSLFVYGQTGQSGELNVTSNSYACYIYGGDITIAGGKVTASGSTGIFAQNNNNGGNVTIKNATVTATGTSYFGIISEYGNITIDNSNVTATSTGNHGIYADKGNITIASGTVTASGSSTKFGIYTVNGSVTINGGQVTTTGSFGIYTVYGSVAINGGQVSATGNIYGIYAQNQNPSDNITLGWTNASDYIYANKYYAGGTLSIAEGKTFIDEAGNTYSGTIAQADGAYAINGKTLRPYSNSMLFLADDADNTAIISKFNSQPYNVTLAGRKLYKDGYWNTLCLPFNMTAKQVTAQLEPTELKELDTERKWANVNGQWSVSEDGHVTGLDNGTLYLNFKHADAIRAGVPYIIKWASGSNIVDPVFSGVTIDSDDPTAVTFTGGKFVGTYSYTQYTNENKSILLLGEDNTLYYPQPARENPDDETSAMVYPSIGAFRAYFQLDDPASVRAFRLNFGDSEGESQGIKEIEDGRLKIENEAGAWYTLDGVKVNGKPTRKGLYIVNGKKVVIK